MIDAGKLDRRITIQRSEPLQDDFGQEVQVWKDYKTVWAKVEQTSDTERFRSTEPAAVVTTRFTIRWGFNVTPQHQIIYEGKVYDIIGVKEWGRREGQEISTHSRGEVNGS